MRAMVIFDRQPDSSWKPAAVYLATAHRLFGKALPGTLREDQVARVLATSKRPPNVEYTEETGTYEKEWIDWALDAFSNGYSSWTEAVPPERTVTRLYQREVLGIEPQELSRPDLRPSLEPPTLVGRRPRKQIAPQ